MPTEARKAAPGCDVCGSGDSYGDLRAWRGADVIASTRLCAPCHGLFRDTLRAAIDREGPLESMPDLPLRRPASVIGEGAACGICAGERGVARLALRPTAPAGEAGRAETHVCAVCLAWVATFVREETTARRAARRFTAAETAAHGVGICSALGFPERESLFLRETVAGLGGDVVFFVPGGLDLTDAPTVTFAWATPETLATLPRMSAETLERLVVVTLPGHLDDALAFMRAGARDLLVSPLSRQQIAGAFDRMSDTDAIAGRDSETGILSYRPAPRFGLPCHVIAVEPPDDSRPLDVFVSLRRFLRGYDRVGFDAGSLLPVSVYCETSDLARVLDRVRRVLGEGFEVSVLASVEEAPPEEFGWVDGEGARPDSLLATA